MGAVLFALSATLCWAEEPTFTRDVAPIIYEHCAACHRPGGSGPFDLLTAADARKRARQIVDVTQSGFMPPWLPEPRHGEFSGERRLTADEKTAIKSWYEKGAPPGDPADLPPLPEWIEGWQLGEPDLVIRMEPAYELAAEGPEVFRNFVIPIPVEQTRYVEAVELRPGNPRIVHHAVMRTDETFSSRLQAAKDAEMGFGDMNMGDALAPDGYLLSWTPGHQPQPATPGYAWTLRPQTDFVLQLHLQPSGKPEPIQPMIGFHFAERPPERHVAGIMLQTRDIDIPAGEPEHTMDDRYTLPVDVEVLSIYPHAHYLGKRFDVWAVLPDGSREWLVKIDDWDFNWQDEYRYVRPLHLPAGTEIFLTLVFDNSEGNVRNPFWPPRRVRSGSRSVDEMGTVTLQVNLETLADKGALYESLARQDLEKDPDDWVAHSNIAFSAELAGRIEEAIRSYREVLRLNPTRTKAYNGLGRVLQASGDTAGAERRFRRALQINPEYVNAHVNLGNLLRHKKKFTEAEHHLRRSIALGPNSVAAHYGLARLLEQTSRKGEAFSYYERTLELSPDHAGAHNNLAGLLVDRGLTARAIDHYRRALELSPEMSEAHNNLGNVLLMTGEAEQAIEHYRRALELDADAADARSNLEQALLLKAEMDAAVAQAERQVEATGGRDVDALMTLADTYASVGRIDAALETATRALDLASRTGPGKPPRGYENGCRATANYPPERRGSPPPRPTSPRSES